jgi:large subunit ribosomal protein L34
VDCGDIPGSFSEKQHLQFSNICFRMLAMSFTYNPKKKKRATTHGFLVRGKTAAGKKVLLRRRRKGRAKLTV